MTMTEAQEIKLNRIIKKLEDARKALSEFQTEWPYLNKMEAQNVSEASEYIKRAIDCL